MSKSSYKTLPIRVASAVPKRPSNSAPFKIITRCLLVFGVLVGAIPLALAQGTDSEPNNTCAQAQDMGSVNLPFVIKGSLDTPPGVPDVDFFKISGVAGSEIRVDYEGAATGKGTLEDPYLGLYDSACNFVQFNDDNGGTSNSQLRITIPADGLLILGASSCCDSTFSGKGDASGTYQLTIATPPQTIGSISGRVVDERTGVPLDGQAPPFAYVELLKCTGGECVFEASLSARADGRFRFDQNSAGDLLEVGTYQVRAFADDHESAQTERFDVSANEDLDLGDIRLPPPIIEFSEIRQCDDLPAEGGLCRYSVRITNNLPTELTGSVWSLVDGSRIGSPYDSTLFQSGENDVKIAPGAGKVFNFQFNVPNTVANGAFMCTRVYVGQSPNPRFNTLVLRSLFCLEKGQAGLSNISAAKANNLLLRPSNKVSR